MYYLALAVFGCLLGAFLVWLDASRRHRRVEILERYVDALMREGPASVTAMMIRAKYSKDKTLLGYLNTARDLYLAFHRGQKTGGVGDM